MMSTVFSLLNTPCHTLLSMNTALVNRLKKINVLTLQDVLFHLPLRYQDRTCIVPIGALCEGTEVLLQGVIIGVQERYRPRRQLTLQLSDGTGHVYIRLFYYNSNQQKQLRKGQKISCFGEVRHGYSGLELVHPEYRLLETNTPAQTEQSFTAVYPTTEGVSQQTWRRLIHQALSVLPDKEDALELLPVMIRERYQLYPLVKALQIVHRPCIVKDVQGLIQGQHPAQQRLAFEELLAHQLSLRMLRATLQACSAPVPHLETADLGIFINALPFHLTSAQKRVLNEINMDLHAGKPMLRLIQGDVGSGKTVVAFLSMLSLVQSGWQAVLMAPTEILAEQHYHLAQAWLSPLGIEVGWLTGQLTGKTKTNTLKAIQDGKIQIIIGTHALFQKKVIFARLGFVVVDEQHRFGVEQRLALRHKTHPDMPLPHQLMMTATPIPRTLTMTAYADLDVSVIDELPPGRQPVQTVVIPNQRREEVIEKIRQACQQQAQVYWVCTLIEESEQLACQAAETTQAMLQAALGAEIHVGLIHGRLPSAEKETLMKAFKDKEIHLLVATTVIEVGMDVPNASLMIIENPERLGLSQLHQLRGRVGRGQASSVCVLLYQSPLSAVAKERLSVMRETNDGFVIAERDLVLRGAGDILGTRQTGLMSFRVADLVRDEALLPKVQAVAQQMQAHYPLLVEALVMRWVGAQRIYAEV